VEEERRKGVEVWRSKGEKKEKGEDKKM